MHMLTRFFLSFGGASPVTPSALAELLDLLDRKAISSSAARQVCPHLLRSPATLLAQDRFHVKLHTVDFIMEVL